MSTYVYVDGESHFIRSSDCLKNLHGADAALEDIVAGPHLGASTSYPDNREPMIRLERRSKFFWDITYPLVAPHPYLRSYMDGAVYFTDFSGGEAELHEARVFIRKQGFDPQVIKELRLLASKRENCLKIKGILEKPKGVDIGLTVRLLEDSYYQIFDLCYLFTSDVDYVPVIHAIQRVGRKVVVFGYKDGLGNQSDLEYVPDAFIDLSEHVSKYTLQKPASE